MVPILVSRFAALSLADTHFDRRSTIVFLVFVAVAPLKRSVD